MESEMKKIESILRKIPSVQKILNNERRVQCIRGHQIMETLSKQGLEQETIIQIMNLFLDQRILVKGKIEKGYVKLNLDVKFKKDDDYIWVYEKTNHYNILISLVIIIISIALLMFQIWPDNLKKYMFYSAYPFTAFLGFMMFTGFIRLIFFGITFFTHPPGIWIFPNLFADVGFKDSFIPVWEYHGVDTKPKKKDE